MSNSLMAATALMLGTVLGTAQAENVLSKQWYFVQLDAENQYYGQMFSNGKPFKLNAQNCIDLDDVTGSKGKAYDRGVAYQEFELKEDQILEFGAGADWWFEVYLNGVKIYATDNRGNLTGAYAADNHVFTARGRKGINHLSVMVTRGNNSWMFCFAEQNISGALTVKVDKNKLAGPIKIMNAINNAPIRGSAWSNNNNMKSWQELDIPYGRTHDSASLAAYGGEHIVDVHRIFKDFSKDPYDPASYDFSSTDRFLQMMQEGRTKVFYRLGATIEHTYKKVGTQVPADFKKWAIICEHIIRHYNEGWANGYKMNIEYWEIWNEPDLRRNPSPTWGGSKEQFFELYRTTALHLKKCFPNLKIGGPAMAGGGDAWMRSFLQSMTTGERVPLDFFSWHIYTADTPAVIEKAANVRKMLDEFGYHKTESILNEWNYVRSWNDTAKRVEVITSLKGAAFVSAVMSSCQNNPVDMLMYYDARPCTWNGIWSAGDYRKLKTYYVFLLWKRLRELGQQISIDSGSRKGLYAVGATNGKELGIMLTRYFDSDTLPETMRVTVQVPGVDLRGVKVFMIDENKDLEDVPYRMTAEGDLVIDMPALSVVYIEK